MLLSKRQTNRGAKKQAKSQEKLKSVLGGAEVPTFPLPVIKSLEALRNPDATASTVAAALEMDPGLSVRLLKLVNSAAFNPAKPVESVDRAVAVAGFSSVESLVLSVGINKALPAADVDGFDHVRFWQAAARRATIARALAGELHPASANVSFTAGLLQDMAIPLLASARTDYRPLLIEWHNGGDDLHLMEQSTFGWSHSDIALMLCQEWGLPDALATAISGHHQDGDEAPPAVQLAAPFREEDRPDIADAVITRADEQFGLAPDRVVGLIEQAETDAGEVAALFT
jgi:HD-like signal output (HDOD) protein